MKKITAIASRCPHRFAMTSAIFPMLLLALALCGCEQNIPLPETTAPETTAAIQATFPAGLYAPSEMEARTNGAVRAFPLGVSDAKALTAWAGGLLVFSGEDTTELTLLTGDSLSTAASLRLSVSLSPEDASFQLWDRTMAYFDSAVRETVVLDSSLNPITRIAAPEGLSGVPLLSTDRNTLYYCTARALMAWDLETGIHRTVKEMASPGQSVAGLHCHDTVIQCTCEDGHLFLAADTGRQEAQWGDGLCLQSWGDRFYAAFPLGFDTALVFGSGNASQILLPATMGSHWFLPLNSALVSARQSGETQSKLDCYDLESGTRLSQLTLDTETLPTAVAGSGGIVSILLADPGFGCDTIYCWDVSQMPINDGQVYTAPYLSDPKEQDLAQCREYAEKIAARHGIEILIGKEAAAVQPWDYHLEAETQPAIVMRELGYIEQRLGNYPAGILAAAAADFSSLKLCLVRSVRGSAESGSVSQATGVQFLEGTSNHVAIATGRFGEQALYHELFHILETHILVNSTAFDRWEDLNPTGFQYDYSYITNAARNSGIYLQGADRSFIDTYSMSFPKEDRARIFEYAMLPGCSSLFEAAPMQEKLCAICDGLREAYGLQEAEETFRWEQYRKK